MLAAGLIGLLLGTLSRPAAANNSELAPSSPSLPALALPASSPVMTPLATELAGRTVSILPSSGGQLLMPLSFGEGNPLKAGGSASVNQGIGLFYFNSGSKFAGLGGLTPTSNTYGIVDNLSLLAPSKSGGAGGLGLKGQFYLSDASTNSAKVNAGKNSQAYNQAVTYSAHNLSISASFLNVGKSFADGGAFATALASSDQATRDAAQYMLSHKGQDEQKLSMDLGSAKSGLVSFNYDDLTDTVNKKKTLNQSMGFTIGDASRSQFTFLNASALDRVSHYHDNTQSFGLRQMLGSALAVTATHATENKGTAGSVISSGADRLQLSLAPKPLGFGLDFTSQQTHDSHGGYDHQTSFGLKRQVSGLTFGLNFGNEDKKLVSGAGATPSVARIRTMGYTIEKRINNLFSVSSNWLSTTDSSRAPGRRRYVTETTKFELTPTKDFSVQNQFTTDNGVDNRSTVASLALPKTLGPALAGAKLSASVNETVGGSVASNLAQKVALDKTIAGHASHLLPSFLAADTILHLETGQAKIGTYGGVKGGGADVRALKLAGALASVRGSKWSYTYATQTPTAGHLNLPDAHEFDLSLPVRKMTLGFYDHDQIDQNNGAFKHGTDRHLSFGGPLTSDLNLALDAAEGHDYTCVHPAHTRLCGIHLWGRHGLMQNLDFQIQRQLETEDDNGRDASTIYKLNFNLPETAARRLALTCNVITNTYSDRPNTKDHIDATVGFDFAQGF